MSVFEIIVNIACAVAFCVALLMLGIWINVKSHVDASRQRKEDAYRRKKHAEEMEKYRQQWLKFVKPVCKKVNVPPLSWTAYASGDYPPLPCELECASWRFSSDLSDEFMSPFAKALIASAASAVAVLVLGRRRRF